MAMSAEEWRKLVHRLEPEARRDQRAYARKVALLGMLGYAVIGLALVALAGLAAAVLYIAVVGAVAFAKLLIPIVGLGFVVFRSLAVKIEPPDGLELHREQAPKLFEMIDEVRAAVRGPAVNSVLVDGDANASIVQIPRRGLVFGSRNYLILGLPYMQAMSAGQFRAVVAHELGHLSKNHGRFGSWIYRIQATWWQLLAGLERRRSMATWPFRRFFEWYVPRFDAYSFPLRRAHEYEADLAAAQAAGPLAVGSSLLAGTVAARHLGRHYWARLYERATHQQQPPRTAFAPIAAELAAARGHERARFWMESELRREPSADDTHPSTEQRIHSLGLSNEEVLADVAATPARTAAAEYLGQLERTLVDELDELWRASIADAWHDRYLEGQQSRSRLRDLDQQASSGSLAAGESRERAELTEELRGAASAMPLYRELVERDSADGFANFAVGRLMLEQGDEGGLAHLERAIESEADTVLPACGLAAEFLVERGRHHDASAYHERAERHIRLLEAAGAERQSVRLDDEFIRHDLSDEQLWEVRSAAAWLEDVRRVYVVRRRNEHLDDDYPLYVFAVVPANHWRTIWRESSNDDTPSLADRFANDLKLPVDFQVLQTGPRGGSVERRFAAHEGALVYDREAA
jgi:Zn-dependent protease with chaperone function